MFGIPFASVSPVGAHPAQVEHEPLFCLSCLLCGSVCSAPPLSPLGCTFVSPVPLPCPHACPLFSLCFLEHSLPVFLFLPCLSWLCFFLNVLRPISLPFSLSALLSPSSQTLGPCRCEPGFLGRACDLHLWENQGAGWWHSVSAGDPAFSARIGAAGAFLSPPGLLAVFGGKQMGRG